MKKFTVVFAAAVMAVSLAACGAEEPAQVPEEVTEEVTEVEEAVEALIREQGMPRNFTGTIPYNGFKIVVRRPKSYTWEQNNQLDDANLDYYKKQHEMYVQLSDDLKELRRDMKRTGEKLEKDHPNSDSIKYGLTISVSK